MKAALAFPGLGILATFRVSLEVTRAAAFHFMAVGQLFLTYPSRHTWTRPLTNHYLHAAVVGGMVIQFGAASLPFVSNLLGNAALPVELWVAIFASALLSWGLAEIIARYVWRTGLQSPSP